MTASRLSVPEALARAVRLVGAGEPSTENVRVEGALGRISAATVRARANLPPHDQAVMDGIAIRLRPAETRKGTRAASRRLIGRSLPGDHPRKLPRVGYDTAVEIVTGGPLPPGADTVVRSEQTIRRANAVRPSASIPRGRDVAPRGGDFRPGTLIVAKGETVRPWHIAALIANGHRRLRTFARPRVGVLATGDEIASRRNRGRSGTVPDTSRPLLLSMIREGGLVPVDLGHAPDSVGRIRTAVRNGLKTCDLVITIGGSSRGIRDHARAAVDGLPGVRWAADGVRMRPGGTSSIAVIGRRPVFLLGGPPVAAYAGFVGLVEPFLRKRDALPRALRETLPVRLGHHIAHSRGGRELLRVRLVRRGDRGQVAVVEGQSSARLSSLTRADALLILTEDHGDYRAGERVTVIPMSHRSRKSVPGPA